MWYIVNYFTKKQSLPYTNLNTSDTIKIYFNLWRNPPLIHIKPSFVIWESQALPFVMHAVITRHYKVDGIKSFKEVTGNYLTILKHTGEEFKRKIRILPLNPSLGQPHWPTVTVMTSQQYRMTQKRNFRQYRIRPLSCLVKSLGSHTVGVHCTTGYLLLTVRQMSPRVKALVRTCVCVCGWSKQEDIRTPTPWLSMNTLPYVWMPNEPPKSFSGLEMTPVTLNRGSFKRLTALMG